MFSVFCVLLVGVKNQLKISSGERSKKKQETLKCQDHTKRNFWRSWQLSMEILFR